jgi:hypothetical protein
MEASRSMVSSSVPRVLGTLGRVHYPARLSCWAASSVCLVRTDHCRWPAPIWNGSGSVETGRSGRSARAVHWRWATRRADAATRQVPGTRPSGLGQELSYANPTGLSPTLPDCRISAAPSRARTGQIPASAAPCRRRPSWRSSYRFCETVWHDAAGFGWLARPVYNDPFWTAGACEDRSA